MKDSSYMQLKSCLFLYDLNFKTSLDFFKGSLTIILVKISSMNSNVKIIFKNTGGLLQYLKIVETCVS